MENQSGDVTGFVADCIQRLLSAGFDADAFETAKWAGIACLGVLGLSILVGFAARVYRGPADLQPPVTENQFRWLLYIGALLIALPVVGKVTSEVTPVEFQDTDRVFAQQVCSDQLQAFAQTAEIEGLRAELNALAFAVAQSPDPSSGGLGDEGDFPSEAPMVETRVNQDILGSAVSIFYRSARAQDAEEIQALLQEAGAGVIRRNTDLSETARGQTARRGDTYVLSDNRAGKAPGAIDEILRDLSDIEVTDIIQVDALTGTPVQILLY